jgi:hypothetical protein
MYPGGRGPRSNPGPFGQAMSWDQRVFEPIMLPGGRKLATLRDAALYITKLPKAEHDANEW